MSAVGPRHPGRPQQRPPWLVDAERLDLAVYAAIAATPSPALDRAMGGLTRAADHSKLSLAAAAVLAVFGGADGRRAASGGLAAVGVTATLVNVGLKLVARRRRPDPVAAAVPITRQVKMPVTRSFPSGHSAAAFAFATGVGEVLPSAAIPLRALASIVAYSRVHTGVHYPSDVIAGALVGVSLAELTGRTLRRRMPG
jgi:membrane-associated phospholipid phosphatase